MLAAAMLAAAASPARADDGGAARVWAPYVVVGASTIEIRNVGDHPTMPLVTLYLRLDGADPSCTGGTCVFQVQGPLIEPGGSWVFEPVDFPDGAIGGASLDAAIETGTGANLGATTFDPTGRLAASVTIPSGSYDAVAATTELTLTGVSRRVSDQDGATTAIRIIGGVGLVIDWYRDDQLVVEQQTGVGSYCCGEAGFTRTGEATIDPRDVDGLDDDARYTVVITRSWDGDGFAAVLTDSSDDR